MGNSDRPTASIEDVVDAFADLRAANSGLIAALAEQNALGSSDVRALYFLAGHPDGTPKELSARLGLTTGATTALIDRLDAAGLITRRPHPSDRRSVVLEVTTRGHDLSRRNRRLYVDAWTDPLERHDLTALHAALCSMAAALRAATAEPAGEVVG